MGVRHKSSDAADTRMMKVPGRSDKNAGRRLSAVRDYASLLMDQRTSDEPAQPRSKKRLVMRR